MAATAPPMSRPDQLGALAKMIAASHIMLNESGPVQQMARASLRALTTAAHTVLGYGPDAPTVHHAVFTVPDTVHDDPDPQVALDAITRAIEEC
jgi:hypothetical protein